MKKIIINILITINIILLLLSLYKNKLSSDSSKYINTTNNYNNYDNYLKKDNDIVGYIKLEDTKYNLLQGVDNSYYLRHDANKNKYEGGSIMVDYRCNLNKLPCYIYSHSSSYYNLPFNLLAKYQDKTYFHNNKYIEIEYLGIKHQYEIINIIKNYEEMLGNYLYLQTCDLNKDGLIIIVLKSVN